MASAAAHADTREDEQTVGMNQMEPATTARTYRAKEKTFVLPLEVAKETASGGGTHFALVIVWWVSTGMTRCERRGETNFCWSSSRT